MQEFAFLHGNDIARQLETLDTTSGNDACIKVSKYKGFSSLP